MKLLVISTLISLLCISAVIGDSWKWLESTSFRSGVVRYGSASAGLKDLILFGGGRNASYYDIVDIYDQKERAWLPNTTFPSGQGRIRFAAAGAGDLIIFGGGYAWHNNSDNYYATVDIYNVGTRSWESSTAFPNGVGRSYLTAAGNIENGLVFFAGGHRNSEDLGFVEIYDVDAQDWLPTTNFSSGIKRRNVGSVSSGSLVFFAGGNIDSWDIMYPTVDIYDAKMKKWLPSTNFSSGLGRSDVACAANGDFVFFGGGWDYAEVDSAVVDIYNVRTMSWMDNVYYRSNIRRWNGQAASIGSFVFFSGGEEEAAGVWSDVVDIYDTSSDNCATKFLPPTKLPSREPRSLSVGSTGDLVLFAGGRMKSINYATVDILEVQVSFATRTSFFTSFGMMIGMMI